MSNCYPGLSKKKRLTRAGRKSRCGLIRAYNKTGECRKLAGIAFGVRLATSEKKAADQGEAMARLNLGRMYFKGTGVPKDYAQAYLWTNLAAAQELEKAVNRRG